MPGAELLFLQNKGCVRKGGFHHFGLVAGHNPDVFGKYGAQGRKHTGQHGFAQHGLQNLGLVGMHAGALACRQNEGRVFWHYCLLISAQKRNNFTQCIASCQKNGKGRRESRPAHT